MPAYRIVRLLFGCTLLGACVSGDQNPRFDSKYVGKPSADFFLAYGPPADVISYDAIPKGADPLNYPQGDPKELVYYWSSINKSVYTARKNAEPITKECNLAIQTRADGTIMRIEVQSTSEPIEAAKAYCQTIVQ